MKKLEEYNAIFGQKQIQNIHYTLSMIENKTKYDKIETLIKTNIQKSTDWCIKYNVPYNILNANSNIFLQNSNDVLFHTENTSANLHPINKPFFT